MSHPVSKSFSAPEGKRYPVHLSMTAAARRDLRLAAAALGMTMSALVTHWAKAAAQTAAPREASYGK